MELWFSEFHAPDVKHSIRVNRHLYSQKSDYQQIDILRVKEEFDLYEQGVYFWEGDDSDVIVKNMLVTYLCEAIGNYMTLTKTIDPNNGNLVCCGELKVIRPE